MNIGAVQVDYKPVEREVWLTASGMDDGSADGMPEEAAVTVAYTRREAVGLAWLIVRAAVFGR